MKLVGILMLGLPFIISAASCSLCSRKSSADIGVDGLLHPMDFVNSKGKRCAQLMVELFKLDETASTCIRSRDLNYVRCCTKEGATIIPQDPPPPPPQYNVVGPYRRCDLCVGGKFPTVVGMVINLLYVGPGTCSQYYEMGQEGWIQNHLCSALQYFAKEPCGC